MVCYASSTAQTLTGELTKENTNIKFFDAKLSPWDVLVSTSRMTFAGGGGGKLYLNGFYLGANYEYHYIDNLAEAASTESIKGSSIYVPTKSRNGDATIGYFHQKVKLGKVRVKLKDTHRTTTYARFDAHYNKIFGVQIGYKSGFSQLTIPSGVNVQDYYAPSKEPIVTESGMTTYMTYKWITFGPSFGKIIDVEGNFNGYGIRKRRSFERFYANVIIATNSTLEDVYYAEEDVSTNNSLVHRYVLNGNVPMSNVGFNVGIETFKFYGFGVVYGIEAGIMPGVKISGAGNGYFAFKWGIILGKAW